MSSVKFICQICQAAVDDIAEHYISHGENKSSKKLDYQPRMAQLAASGQLPEKQARDLDYQTPEYVLSCVRAYFGGDIPLDPATCASNPTKAKRFFTPVEDGLKQDWNSHWFVNPPYGKGMRDWIEKIGEIANRKFMNWSWDNPTRPLVHGIALLPVNRTETSYWQEHIAGKANAVCWVRKRIAFIRPSTGLKAAGNPYSSAIWGFGVDCDRFKVAFESLGKVNCIA